MRQKNHRRKNCGTTQKITIAYYLINQQISDLEKFDLIQNHPNLAFIDKVWYDGRLAFVFKDSSVICYHKDEGFYLSDKWARKNRGKEPSKDGDHKRKKVFV